MAALSDGGDALVMLTVSVGKGRDNLWTGAVGGLRLNGTIYDSEEEEVKHKGAPHEQAPFEQFTRPRVTGAFYS